MGGQWLNGMCEVLKGGVLAGVVAIVLLLVCAVLVSMGMLPVRAMEGAVLAVCILGALVGGVYAVRRLGRHPGWGRYCFCSCSPPDCWSTTGPPWPTGGSASSAPACVAGRSRGSWAENQGKSGDGD